MMLGIYGLIYEASSPGIGFGLVIGSISLLLAFFSLKILPINYVGVILILLGPVLMVLDTQVQSFGVLTAGGIVSLTLGGMMMMRSPEGFYRVSLHLIIPVAVFLGAFTLFAIGAVIRSQRNKTLTGKEGMEGAEGKTVSGITAEKEGMVFLHGEYWKAAARRPISAGKRIRVTAVRGNLLEVEET